MGHHHHTFHNPPSATPSGVRAALARAELGPALDAMVGCALYGDGDWKEAQELDALDDIEVFLHPRRARWRGRVWRLIRPWTWTA
ncbi:hypothetical protein ABZY58_13530 [Micromonospora tulbaghiae]|uniref:hypothetical protein n=1 Tax=Micromonospora tulbaghiae TaxID=479978 RepID=UPI0033BDB42B